MENVIIVLTIWLIGWAWYGGYAIGAGMVWVNIAFTVLALCFSYLHSTAERNKRGDAEWEKWKAETQEKVAQAILKERQEKRNGS